MAAISGAAQAQSPAAARQSWRNVLNIGGESPLALLAPDFLSLPRLACLYLALSVRRRRSWPLVSRPWIGVLQLFKKYACYLSLSLLMAPLVAAVEMPLAPTPPLQLSLEQLSVACSDVPTSLNSAAREQLKTFYQQRQYAPVWTVTGQLDALLGQLEDLADDGLNPASYRLDSLRAWQQQPASDCHEIFTTHVYLQALQHLLQGRLAQSQVEPRWQPVDTPALAADQVVALAMLGLGDLPSAFAQARPALSQYQNLRSAYALRRQQPLPDWQLITSGPLLRPDMHDARVPALAQRLLNEGYLSALTSAEDDLYGASLVTAVQAFQQQHALQADGVVGAATLEALNVSPAQRLAQLRLNLERWRWLAHDLQANTVLVNVAAAQLFYYQNFVAVWQTRTQVGRAARQTPLLKSQITRLTLNPTWTVPPTILREDKLPEIRRDQAFLDKHGLRVLDHQGQVLDASSIDWNNPGKILLRQDAGPKNPLGRVAIRFPNPFSVYLHDTPSQQLFSKGPRAFSSGCVRVEAVMQLVDFLLTPAERERMNTLLASGRTYEFRLSNPLPIILGYWTTQVDERGQLLYAPDIYARDQALLTALDRAQL